MDGFHAGEKGQIRGRKNLPTSPGGGGPFGFDAADAFHNPGQMQAAVKFCF
jgi:hypothetical protein